MITVLIRFSCCLLIETELKKRFDQIDPLVDEYAPVSPFSFAGDDPINFNDPSGASLPYIPPGHAPLPPLADPGGSVGNLVCLSGGMSIVQI
jgi:hypothetical protein